LQEAMMIRLFGVLFSMIGTALAGSGVVVALVSGNVDVRSILLAAGIGAMLALPLSWMVARKLID
jgi:hypothetical protein